MARKAKSASEKPLWQGRPAPVRRGRDARATPFQTPSAVQDGTPAMDRSPDLDKSSLHGSFVSGSGALDFIYSPFDTPETASGGVIY